MKEQERLERIVVARRKSDRVFGIETWAGQYLATESRSQDPVEAVGPAPMEMLLAGLASCAGGTFAQVLEKMRLPFDDIVVAVDGQRADGHPRVWVKIHYEIVVEGSIPEDRAQRALVITESACPASVMLSNASDLTASVRVIASV